jgi:hypothetical protein
MREKLPAQWQERALAAASEIRPVREPLRVAALMFRREQQRASAPVREQVSQAWKLLSEQASLPQAREAGISVCLLGRTH